MSAQAVNMLFGVGRIYVKRSTDSDGKYRLVGSVKGKVQFVYKPTYAEQRPSDTLVMVRRDKVEEMAQLKFTLVDFRMDQMRYALGLSISTTGLSKTLSIRIAQELITKTSTTTTQTLSRTMKSLTSIAFTSLDRATDYTRGTDFTVLSKTKFRATSAAFKGQKAVRAYYTKIFAVASGIGRIDVGDKTTLQNISVMYTHQKSNGKHIAIQFPLASIHGDLSLAFNEKEYTTPEITIDALGDPTQPRGKKLFTILNEP